MYWVNVRIGSTRVNKLWQGELRAIETIRENYREQKEGTKETTTDTNEQPWTMSDNEPLRARFTKPCALSNWQLFLLKIVL